MILSSNLKCDYFSSDACVCVCVCVCEEVGIVTRLVIWVFRLFFVLDVVFFWVMCLRMLIRGYPQSRNCISNIFASIDNIF